MRFMFDSDESFSFETLRAVGYTAYGNPRLPAYRSTLCRCGLRGRSDRGSRQASVLSSDVCSCSVVCNGPAGSCSNGGAKTRPGSSPCR